MLALFTTYFFLVISFILMNVNYMPKKLPIIENVLLAGGNIAAIINMYTASENRTVIVRETQCLCLEDTD